jgi:tetraacyldisaccharide 4'-kinase
MSLVDFWYEKRLKFLTSLLLPFSLIFRDIVAVRRLLYRLGLRKVTKFPVPVVIVGNVTVGGTGKTPMVIWLAKFLQEQGYYPGVVARGYGVNIPDAVPRLVKEDSLAANVGDEPLLIARHVDCPIMISPNRVAAIEKLLAEHKCDMIISDDGLQHYAMGRDIEMVLIDSQRQFGNGYCLPAGPLREPIARIKTVDFIINNENTTSFEEKVLGWYIARRIKVKNEFNMQLVPGKLTAVFDLNVTIDPAQLADKEVHALAGIGNPARFFQTVRQLNLDFIEHEFPDHHQFKPSDIDFGEDSIVIMTEKDAVKCREFANERHWFLPVAAQLSEKFKNSFLEKLKQVNKENNI